MSEYLHIRATPPPVWQELVRVSHPGGAVAHSLVAEYEGGPGGQLVAPASFTGGDCEASLDLSRISLTHFSAVQCTETYLMLAGEVGNILMDSFMTDFR